MLDDFDWEGDMPLKTPHNELIIYEAHVRGFTKDESSGVKFKGTYAGLREKMQVWIDALHDELINYDSLCSAEYNKLNKSLIFPLSNKLCLRLILLLSESLSIPT